MKYALLFQVKIAHDYFENKICTGIQFQATPATESICKKHSIVARTSPESIDFLTNAEDRLEFLNILKNDLEEISFEFDMFLSDTNFHNYSTTPLEKIGTLSFDSQNCAVIDGNPILKLEFVDAPSTSQAGQLKINIADVLSYWKSDSPLVFQLNFDARAVQWRYFIINTSNQELTDLKIEGNGDVIFSGPTVVKLANNQEALEFSSGSSLLKLCQKPKEYFKLTDQKLGKVIAHLPNASPNKLTLVEVDGKKIAAVDMFVYL